MFRFICIPYLIIKGQGAFMRFGKKVVIAVGLNPGMFEMLKEVKGLEFLKHSEIHLVSVFKTIDYAYGLGEFSLVFPIADDRKAVEQSIKAALVKLWQDIAPAGFEGKVVPQCLFDENPKDKFCQYVGEVHADAVIVATRKKRGIFESSFAQYVSKHTDADVIILKKNE